jgi:hypothetical protein
MAALLLAFESGTRSHTKLSGSFRVDDGNEHAQGVATLHLLRIAERYCYFVMDVW